LVRPLHVTSVNFGYGIDDNVRLGHIASVGARQVMQQLVPAAAYLQAACLNNGICLKAVWYRLVTLVAGQSFEVDLHSTVQHVVTDDYTMFVHLLNRTDQAVDGVNAYHLSMHTAPMNGSWATRSSQALCLISQPVCGRGLIVLSWECIPPSTLSVYRLWMRPP